MLTEIFQTHHQFFLKKKIKYERYFLKKYDFSSQISILIGPRGIGKTTILLQYIEKKYGKNSHKSLYFQADHFTTRKYSIYEIAEEFEKNGGKLLCIDEIHTYENWSQELKSISDSFPTLQIIASGSSALEIYKGTFDLSRRAIVYTMQGMSFREFLEIQNIEKFQPLSLKNIISSHVENSQEIIKKIEKNGEKILPLFKKYLKYGYYPYFLEYKNNIDLFYITLEQNIHTTIEKDIPSVYPVLNGRSLRKIKNLLTALSEMVPYTPDFKKLKNCVDIGDERTLKNYLEYLVKSGLLRNLEKKGKGISSMKKIEKIFLHNPNLLFLTKPNKGTIRETFFHSILDFEHHISAPEKGDFLIEDMYTIEVGGKNKKMTQISNIENGYIACDDIEIGHGKTIPLWIFGFLY